MVRRLPKENLRLDSMVVINIFYYHNAIFGYPSKNLHGNRFGILFKKNSTDLKKEYQNGNDLFFQ